MKAVRLACAWVLMLMIGCGPSILTVPVVGQVTFEGKPLARGEIAFHPVKVEEGLPHRFASARIGDDGRYSLSTFKHGDGIIPGEYSVVIVSTQGPPPVEVFTKEDRAAAASAIPQLYSDARRTPLRATIPAEVSAPIEINFELTNSGRTRRKQSEKSAP